jgi:hypothetical protein
MADGRWRVVSEYGQRPVSNAGLGRPVRVKALRRADVFAFEPGPASRKHGPTPERCPGQDHLAEMDHPRLLCATEQVAPSALLRASEPVDPRERGGNDCAVS